MNIKYVTDSIGGADEEISMKTRNKERRGSRRLNWYKIKGKGRKPKLGIEVKWRRNSKVRRRWIRGGKLSDP
jgi:hypothetical protein